MLILWVNIGIAYFIIIGKHSHCIKSKKPVFHANSSLSNNASSSISNHDKFSAGGGKIENADNRISDHKNGRRYLGAFVAENQTNDLLNSSLRQIQEKSSHKLGGMFNNKDPNLNTEVLKLGYNKFPNDHTKYETEVNQSERFTENVHKIHSNNKNFQNNVHPPMMPQNNHIQKQQQPQRITQQPTTVASVTSSSSYQAKTSTKPAKKGFNTISTKSFTNSTYDDSLHQSTNSPQTIAVRKDYVAHQIPTVKTQDIKSCTKDAPTKTSMTIMVNMTKHNNMPEDRNCGNNNERSEGSSINSPLMDDTKFNVVIKNEQKLQTAEVKNEIIDKNYNIKNASLQYNGGSKINSHARAKTPSNARPPNTHNEVNALVNDNHNHFSTPKKLRLSKSVDSESYKHTIKKEEDLVDRLHLKNFRQKHDFGDFQILTESPVKVEQPPSATPMTKPPPQLNLTPQQLRVKRQILKKSFSIDV